MDLDAATVARWLEPLAKRPEEIAEVFAERRREITVEWRDGEIREARASLTEGLSARWKGASGQRLAFVSRCDEEGARLAVRAVQKEAGLSPLPVKPSRAREESAARPVPRRSGGSSACQFLRAAGPVTGSGGPCATCRGR
jgi:predicted Zn-dependent protease